MLNNDLKMGLAKPRKSADYFYKNAECDELLFVHAGKGTLKTMLGNIEFSVGDYLIIPRGTIYQLELETEHNVFFEGSDYAGYNQRERKVHPSKVVKIV